MFNASTNGLADNRIFAIEFDTHQNPPFHDPNDNHIGVDINSVTSLRTNDLSSLGIILNQGRKIICWIDYDGGNRYIWVYLAYSPSTKPSSPIIEMNLDLAPYMRNNAYVGFTSATGQRAELHTIYSWWFLTGFGNLSLPTSNSSRPLESLGRRSVVISVFTLAIALGFLCLFCILARRRWQEKSPHLIDVLLPVACWMYWKESIAQGVRLKLAKPTIELLAWLWRTRWTRRHGQLHMKTWRQMLLNCKKMGPVQKGEAWQLEDRRQMQPHHALKGPTYENLVGNTTVFTDNQTKQALKDARPKPAPQRRGKETGKKQRKPPQKVVKSSEPTPLLVPAADNDFESSETQGKVFEPRLKNFRISNASFILMDDESRAKLSDIPVVTSSGGESQLEAGILTPSSRHTERPAHVKREAVSEEIACDERNRADGGKDVAAMLVGGGSSSSSVLDGQPGERPQSSDITFVESGAMPKKVEESSHPSSNAESAGEPHATQSWLFD